MEFWDTYCVLQKFAELKDIQGNLSKSGNIVVDTIWHIQNQNE